MIENHSIHSELSQPSPTEKLVHQLEVYAHYLNQSGYGTTATQNHFRFLKEKADPNLVAIASQRLHHTIELIDEAEREGLSPRSEFGELELLKRFLAKLGLSVPKGLPTLLDKDDVIEVYDRNAVQAYRSFNFFTICSYSLEDIFLNEWWNLYERSVFITNKIGDMAVDIFANNKKEPVWVKAPEHWVNEIWSPMKGRCLIRQKILYPIVGPTQQIDAIAATFEVVESHFEGLS